MNPLFERALAAYETLSHQKPQHVLALPVHRPTPRHFLVRTGARPSSSASAHGRA